MIKRKDNLISVHLIGTINGTGIRYLFSIRISTGYQRQAMSNGLFIFRWMSLASPLSMITAIPVFATDNVRACASRSSAQSESTGLGDTCMKLANCTK